MRSGATPKLMNRSRMLREGARKRVISWQTPRMCSSRSRAARSSTPLSEYVVASARAAVESALGRRRSISRSAGAIAGGTGADAIPRHERHPDGSGPAHRR